jgi:metal transporter CNNM
VAIIVWIGVVLCLSQSAMFSGLNLAFFSVSRLQLELESAQNNRYAKRIQAFRKDSNLLLVTILWGNVSVNVLLALLSNSALAGVASFLFSTFVITIVGEITPQAYFSRHALKMAYLLAPVLRFYQILLYPIAKPTAFILDKLLGPEGIRFLNEKALRELIRIHVDSKVTDIGKIEARGALNFLDFDDLPLSAEGELVDPLSVIKLPFDGSRPVFPAMVLDSSDEFLRKVQASGKKWVIIVSEEGAPRVVVEANRFLRDAFLNKTTFNPYRYCHRPIIATNEKTRLGEIIPLFKVEPVNKTDDVIDQDIILLWGKERRIITGSDILGRLLQGIVQNKLKFGETGTASGQSRAIN